MIRLLVFCFLCLCTVAASAATCTSRQNGNWTAANRWNCGSGSSNGPPANGDVVVVNHAITLNGNTNTLSSLTVNNGDSIIDDGSSRTINLSGNLVNNGTITLTSGTTGRIIMSGTSAWSGTGTLSLDYLDVNNQDISLAGASTMAIYLGAADPLLNVNGGSFNNGASPNNAATMYFNGAAQSLDDYSLKYPNVVLSGGTKTVTSSSFAVLGNLTINGGATLSTDSVSTVNLGGNLTISGTLSSFSGGSTTWTFDGTAAQGISAAATFRNVVLNNSSGLTLGGNLTIGDASYGALTLTSGKLTTGAFSVVLPQNCSGSAITRSSGTWINGNLQLTMPAWGVSCVFDVGDSSNYAPITFTYPWHAAPLGGTVTGSTTSGDHPDTVTGISGVSQTKGVNRYWTLAAGGGSSFYTYDGIFQYCNAVSGADCTVNDVDAAATASSFVVAERVSGTWSSFTPTSPTTNSRQVAGLTSTGVFVIGEAASACPQPANTPVGMTLTCQCDGFGRAALNPSPIFTNGNWIVSTSGNDSTGIVPYINGTTGFLRLTERTGNNSKAVTAPGFFPAAGNYISVEFKHYAYNGSGADGISAILSDYSIPPVPGAPGGSLGFANRNAEVGFAGGWIGVGIDEYGNYSANNEGKHLGPGFRADAVAVRGSGSGTTGYAYLAGTAAGLSPGVDNAGSTSPAYGHYYQVVVDARNYGTGQTFVAVNRDTTGTGASYASLIPSFEIFSTAATAGYTQSAVPVNFQLSFTGSTGGSINIHELDSVRICAQYFVPPDGGTAGGFSAIDDAYTSTVQNFLAGHIYTKLAGTPFKLKVAALSNSQILTTYAASGTKNVAVKLVDNSDGLCGTDLTRVTECAKAVCNGKSAVTGGSQTLAFTSTDKGIKTSADFTLGSAYANLVAVMTEGAVTACSLDSFSVRPTKITSVTSTNATNIGLAGTPKFKAGTDSFALAATANAAGYTGTPKINTAAMSANPAGGTVGAFTPAIFPAAVSGVSTSVATGSFTYGEVGNFRFIGFDPAVNTLSARGIYDDSWVTIDSVSTKNDCVAGSYANTKDSSGKYGCLFGLQDSSASAPNSVLFGRFVPDHFAYLGGGVSQFCTISTAFTYMGQAKLGVAYRLQALNGGGGVTTNYSQALGYPVVSPALVAEDQAAGNQGCDLASRIGSLAAAQWVSGVYNLNDANADNAPETATAIFSRPSAPGPLSLATCAANKAAAGGPFGLLDIGVSMSDSDAGAVMSALDMDAGTAGVCSGAGCTARKLGSVNMLYGRLWLGNAYGSDQLDLALPFEVQYWNGSTFVKNTADGSASCTAFGTGNVALGNKQGGLSSYTGPVSVSAMVSGAGKITLPKPGSATAGSVDLVVTLGSSGSPANCPNLTGATSASLAHLSGKWCGSANDRDPVAKATFGIFGSSEKKGPIYIRESY